MKDRDVFIHKVSNVYSERVSSGFLSLWSCTSIADSEIEDFFRIHIFDGDLKLVSTCTLSSSANT